MSEITLSAPHQTAPFPWLYQAGFLGDAEAADYFQRLFQQTPWQQGHIRLFGKSVAEPRLTAWFGDPAAVYRYSGKQNQPLNWTPDLLELKARIEGFSGLCFNSVLVNLYRSGSDSMGAHRDNEPELGADPAIASLSLGARRKLVCKNTRQGLRQELWLDPGSLLLMLPGMQRDWTHELPKTRRVSDPRINLTFRLIKPCRTDL